MVKCLTYKNQTMKKLLCMLIILSFLGLGACKKEKTDPDYCSTTWATQLNDELSAVTSTLMAYSTNPTTTTCNAYKAAMQAYIDALRPFENCTLWTLQQKTAFMDSLDEAEEDLATACQ